MIPPVLKTERLTLRGPGPQDVAALMAFYASPRSAFVGGPMGEDATWRQLACEIGHWTLRGYGRWIAETQEGVAVGMVGLWNPALWPEPELGWDLFEGHEGKGYATEAGRAARDHAYRTLGWTTAISLVKPGNTGSARVAQRLGARPDGQFTHPRFGTLDIWRHPSAAEVAA